MQPADRESVFWVPSLQPAAVLLSAASSAGGSAAAPVDLTHLPDPMAGLPPRLLRTPDAARFLGVSNRTLEKHRTYGTGPVYRKLGGRVVYAVEDLQAWSLTGARKSTSDQPAQRVFPARRLTAAEREAR